MSSWSDDENVSSTSRRGKRPHHIESSSSEDDSDGPQVKSFKRKKAPVLESNSEDSSDSSPLLPNRNFRQKKKMPRVESDESSSDDESAVTVRLGGRVARLESDESTGTSQSSEEATSESGQSSGESSGSGESYMSDDEVMVQAAIQESLANLEQEQKVKQTESPKSTKTPVPSTSAGFTSDSSDGQSEKCPICLLSFTDQEIGSPESCDHIFCAVCIQEWAKNVNTCPVDRQVFSLILVRKCINGKVIRKVPVEHREARDAPEESEMDPTFCEICGLADREDRMLLCDGCDMGYHLECLDPPMENVPVDEWFCPDCSNDTQLAEVVDIEEGEVYDLLDDYVQAIRPRTSRLLPRTRQSERVRATVRELHQERLRRSQNEPAWQVLYQDAGFEFSYALWDDSD